MAMGGCAKPVVDTAAIVLIVLAAKTAIAEPYYVPSGSMEPTLQIGDELLATKYPLRLQLGVAAAFHQLCPTRSASSPRCPSAATSSCFAGRATGRRFG